MLNRLLGWLILMATALAPASAGGVLNGVPILHQNPHRPVLIFIIGFGSGDDYGPLQHHFACAQDFRRQSELGRAFADDRASERMGARLLHAAFVAQPYGPRNPLTALPVILALWRQDGPMPIKPRLFTASGQCCALDEPYQAPVGYFDQPFLYVFDGNALPDNEERNYAGITTLTGADFILRRVAGIDRVCTDFQLRDVLSRLVFNSKVRSTYRDFPILPELLWPAGAGISFDLLPVVKSSNSSGALLSQIAFQGVRRFKGYRRPPSYPYWEDEWKYESDVAIDWDFALGETRRFAIDIHDCDFELLRITECIINPIGGGPPCAPGGINQALKLQLFDQVYEKVFSEPVIDDLIMDNSTDYQGIVPVPGIVYRIGQAIKFEVTSLITPPDPCAMHVQITFHGVRRRPC